MKKIISLGVTIFMLTFCLSVPKLNAETKVGLPDLEPDISMDFKDANLKDVLKAFSIQSGLNFIASQGLQDRSITLYLDKVPMREAMDKLFKANNLSYQLDRDSNLFIVKDWGMGGVETVTKVFYLQHATVSSSSVKEEMANLLRSTPEQTTTGTSISSATSTTEDKGKWKVEDDSGITKAVRKLLSENGNVIEDFRTNSLIVTDTPQRMEIIAQVIASLDVSVSQVMLEVEMLDVSKGTIDHIGFDYSQTPFTVVIGGASADWGGPFGNWGKVFNKGNGSISINDTDIAGNNAAYQVKLDFLRTSSDTKYLARPRILTLNNETAEIKITTQEAVGEKQTITGGGTAVSSSVSEAERYETGVSLRITPQIDSDANEITMFIVPKVTEAFPGAVINSVTKQAFFNPETRGTKTLVRVKDGETVVLGGLIRNRSVDTVSKLPFFGDIPLVGALFRHKEAKPNDERELLVFITPHIVKDTAKLAQAKKVSLPEREQTVATGRREMEIGSALSSFEKR